MDVTKPQQECKDENNIISKRKKEKSPADVSKLSVLPFKCVLTFDTLCALLNRDMRPPYTSAEVYEVREKNRSFEARTEM